MCIKINDQIFLLSIELIVFNTTEFKKTPKNTLKSEFLL